MVRQQIWHTNIYNALHAMMDIFKFQSQAKLAPVHTLIHSAPNVLQELISLELLVLRVLRVHIPQQ